MFWNFLYINQRLWLFRRCFKTLFNCLNASAKNFFYELLGYVYITVYFKLYFFKKFKYMPWRSKLAFCQRTPHKRRRPLAKCVNVLPTSLELARFHSCFFPLLHLEIQRHQTPSLSIQNYQASFWLTRLNHCFHMEMKFLLFRLVSKDLSLLFLQIMQDFL